MTGDSVEAGIGDRIHLLATQLDLYLEVCEVPEPGMQQTTNAQSPAELGPNKRYSHHLCLCCSAGRFAPCFALLPGALHAP